MIPSKTQLSGGSSSLFIEGTTQRIATFGRLLMAASLDAGIDPVELLKMIEKKKKTLNRFTERSTDQPKGIRIGMPSFKS